MPSTQPTHIGDRVNANNPSGTKTALNASDFYLYESYQVELGGYVAVADWPAKADQLATYQAAIGFKVAAVTTTNQANVFNQAEFNYAWYSAMQAGYAAVGWGEFDYAADTDTVPSIVPSVSPPPVAVGTTFTGGIVENGSLFTRNTNLGQIELNSASAPAHSRRFLAFRPSRPRRSQERRSTCPGVRRQCNRLRSG